ncbi:hypothetical protein C7C46_31330 [Streptomyces tateyamensis]|uniref:3-hydroxyacyl-CoA dehydrogenase n=1 Tax=Streptomyces tateyamensis TaxID=565073 RepID=A0A2V4N7J3_9ACTN|nr:Rv3235 family protein [Streptomyces tateyamensis]PYC66478.1 hypothetical protein C7C46_31330 [Streptomyces tateyamensis]
MTETVLLRHPSAPQINRLTPTPGHRVPARPEPRAPRHPRADCGPAADRVPGSGDLAHRFAQRLVEVLAGVRPPGQLVRHTTHDGYRELARLARGNPLRRAGRALPRLGPVHESVPGPGALEVCVRVEAGPRHHVVAFRLERHRRTEQWQCTTVGTW